MERQATGELAAARKIVLHELWQGASLEEAFMGLTTDSVQFHDGKCPHERHAASGKASAGAAVPSTTSSRTVARVSGSRLRGV